MGDPISKTKVEMAGQCLMSTSGLHIVSVCVCVCLCVLGEQGPPTTVRSADVGLCSYKEVLTAQSCPK